MDTNSWLLLGLGFLATLVMVIAILKKRNVGATVSKLGFELKAGEMQTNTEIKGNKKSQIEVGHPDNRNVVVSENDDCVIKTK
jgi:hypothetical protein